MDQTKVCQNCGCFRKDVLPQNSIWTEKDATLQTLYRHRQKIKTVRSLGLLGFDHNNTFWGE